MICLNFILLYFLLSGLWSFNMHICLSAFIYKGLKINKNPVQSLYYNIMTKSVCCTHGYVHIYNLFHINLLQVHTLKMHKNVMENI